MSDNQSRHAYLIIAHANFSQLQDLINLLDDERNDIYLHIDKKVRTVPVFTAKHSGLYMTDRINVVWGGYSLIRCEMTLFSAAAKGHYQYYHLLSGADLPLKTQDYIHRFFEENNGKEFISFDPIDNRTKAFYPRTQYYHLFANYTGKGQNFFSRSLRFLDRAIVFLQKALHISRPAIVPLYKGSNWVSITDAMIQYVLSQEKIVKKQFRFSFCADEVFLQSLAVSSPLCDNIVQDSLRAIDWDRGRPYIYRKEDVPFLLESDSLWGRKFDRQIDSEAIRAIVDHLTGDTPYHNASGCVQDLSY